MDKEAKITLDSLFDDYLDSMILLKKQHPELSFTEISNILSDK